TLLPILRIRTLVANERSAACVLADQISFEPRESVGAADVQVGEEAVVELRLQPLVIAVVDAVVGPDDRPVVLCAEPILRRPGRHLAICGVEAIPLPKLQIRTRET